MRFRTLANNSLVRKLSRSLAPIISLQKQKRIAKCVFELGKSPIRDLRNSSKRAEVTSFLRGSSIEPSYAVPTEREKCNLVIVCGFLGRHELLEIVIKESFHSKYADSIRWVLMGSSDEDLEFLKRIGQDRRICGAIVPNHPVGRKWQTGMLIAGEQYDSQLYCINGSDDLLPHGTLDRLIDHHAKHFSDSEEGIPGLYCCLDWMVADVNPQSLYSPALFHVAYNAETAFQPLGAGRFYSQKFLESVGFTIFDSRLNRLLDDRGFQLIEQNDWSVEYFGEGRFGMVVSVKGGWRQMNAIGALFEVHTVEIEDRSFVYRDLLEQELAEETIRALFSRSESKWFCLSESLA